MKRPGDFEFKIYDDQYFHVEVKKYGYCCWVHEQDLQLSKLTGEN